MVTPGAKSVRKELRERDEAGGEETSCCVLMLPVSEREMPGYMRGIVKCPRGDVSRFQGKVPVTAVTLWSEKIPSPLNTDCRGCAQCFAVGGGIITADGILCTHPNVGKSYSTVHALAKKMFHEKDAECLDCLKCVCPKVTMKPHSERALIEVSSLYEPDGEMCQSLGCPVTTACFAGYLAMKHDS
jgi:hypothetical protein